MGTLIVADMEFVTCILYVYLYDDIYLEYKAETKCEKTPLCPAFYIYQQILFGKEIN